MSPGDRYFRLLLRLLPPSFRRRHGEALAEELDRMKADLGASPRALAVFRLHLAVTWDLLRHAVASRSRLEKGASRAASKPEGPGWLASIVADARFAMRQFGRRWATTLTVLGILSAGMSVSVLLFSFVHSYARLPPRGVPPSDDVVRIRGLQTSPVYGPVVRTLPEAEVDAYRSLTGLFRAVTAWADASVTVDRPGGDAVTAKATLVTGDYFGVLGVRPVLGRGLPERASSDATLERVAVIGHTTWDHLFGRDADVVGKTVHVNGIPLTVMGVAPPGFMGINMLTAFQVWLPLAARDVVLPEPAAGNLAFRAAARLRAGVSPEAATAAVRVVADGMMASRDEPLPGDARDPTSDVVPLLSANGDPNFENDVRRLVASVGALGLLVLLVTCTNVSALLMSVAAARRHETVIRVALGAPRRRVVRQLLTESALLALAAGGAALALVWLVLRTLAARFPTLPAEIGITAPAVAFTFAAALVAGVFFGLAPALHATGVAVAPTLRESDAAVGGGRFRLQRALVVAQVALTQPLVVALVAVLVMVVGQVRPTGRSASPERLISLQLRAATATPGPTIDSGASVEPLQGLMPGLEAALEATPGVAAVVTASRSIGEIGAYRVHHDDLVENGYEGTVRPVGNTAAAGYFGTVGIPLVAGRDFTEDDVHAGGLEDRGGPVPVVIGSRLADRLWPGAGPLGRRLEPVGDSTATLVIAGVAAEPDADRRSREERPEIYVAADPEAAAYGFIIRTDGEAQPLVPQVRRVAQARVPGWTPSAQSIAALEEESLRTFRAITRGLAASGVVALLLSAIGLYAVMAFSVAQRASEIAVRMAVGAPARAVARRFVTDGVRLGLYGLALGLPLSLLGLHVLNAAALEGLAGYPGVGLPQVTAIVMSVVLATAVLATLVPAGRAALVDPASVLRGA